MAIASTWAKLASYFTPAENPRCAVDSGYSSRAAGRTRINEDAVLVKVSRRNRVALVAVADGMGGYAGGARASRAAVAAVERRFRQLGPLGENWPGTLGYWLCRTVAEAHHSVLGARGPAETEAGTTLAVSVLGAQYVGCANIGDTRVYLGQNGRLDQISEDHTAVAEAARSGIGSYDDAVHSAFRHVLTRSLGPGQRPSPHIVTLPTAAATEGVQIVVCTDGVWGMVTRGEIHQLLSRHSSARVAARAIVKRAIAKGCQDDATAAVLRWKT